MSGVVSSLFILKNTVVSQTDDPDLSGANIIKRHQDRLRQRWTTTPNCPNIFWAGRQERFGSA